MSQDKSYIYTIYYCTVEIPLVHLPLGAPVHRRQRQWQRRPYAEKWNHGVTLEKYGLWRRLKHRRVGENTARSFDTTHVIFGLVLASKTHHYYCIICRRQRRRPERDLWINQRARQRNKRGLAGCYHRMRALSYDVGGSYHSIPSLCTGRHRWAAEMLLSVLCVMLCCVVFVVSWWERRWGCRVKFCPMSLVVGQTARSYTNSCWSRHETHNGYIF